MRKEHLFNSTSISRQANNKLESTIQAESKKNNGLEFPLTDNSVYENENDSRYSAQNSRLNDGETTMQSLEQSCSNSHPKHRLVQSRPKSGRSGVSAKFVRPQVREQSSSPMDIRRPGEVTGPLDEIEFS